MAFILYQNDEHTVTLIDVPRSIAEAQGDKDGLSRSHLLSISAPAIPYPWKESKKQAADESADTGFTETHSAYRQAVIDAILDIKRNYNGAWCLERKTPPPMSHLLPYRKRKRYQLDVDDDNEVGQESEIVVLPGTTDGFVVPKVPSAFLRDLSGGNHVSYRQVQKLPSDKHKKSDEEKFEQCFHNSNDHTVVMSIRHTLDRAKRAYNFKIPPHSTYFMANGQRSKDFRESVRYVSQMFDTPRLFDLIIMDPPWNNSSAKNKNSYETIGTLELMDRLLLKMDLDMYIADNGIIGVWITNTPRIRSFVLDPEGGLFKQLNVTLVEEWIWLKVTKYGEPVIRLDGDDRKTYETLLLGRRPKNRLHTVAPVDNVKKRVIVGVPDLHSRKPCVKKLMEDLLSEGYSALELFGRYCVAGWWTWGNEAIKYNWDEYWVEPEEAPGPTSQGE